MARDAAMLLLGLAACLAGCTMLEPGPGRSSAALSADDANAADHGATEQGGPEAGAPCGPISAVGCCDGQTLWWCHQGQLKHKSCKQSPQCGWRKTGVYDCNTSGVADPAGKQLMLCRALLSDAGLPTTDGPASDGPCGGIKEEGCCAGNVVKYCLAGQLKAVDCKLNPYCGWQANGQFYDCGTPGKADPAGKRPRACPGHQLADGAADVFADDARPDQAQVGDSAADSGNADQRNGCGCRVSGGAGSWSALLASLLLLIRRRRRR